jgi:uroporphyrinogen decarboxylase
MRIRSTVPNFLDLCYNSDLATEVTLQPITRFGLDAAIIFSDILVLPDALGQKVDFQPAVGPVLKPIRTREQIRDLRPETVEETLNPVYESISKVAAKLDHEVALIGFAGAPWTVATYMVEGGSSKGFSYIKNWATSDQEGFGELIKQLVDSTARHLMKQVEAGAEVIQIFDSWAGILSPRDFELWCVEPVAEIVRRVKADFPEIPIIGFPKGAGVSYEGYADKTGVDGVSVDYTVEPSWIAQALQSRSTVQGNLDPHILRVGGSIMIDEVQKIKKFLGNGPFIFNLGHGILPDTSPTNVSHLIEIVRDF